VTRIEYIEDIKKWEEEFEFYYPVKVRFSETDMFGHLNNTVPFVYFEQARIEFFKSLGLMAEWLRPESETILVVADLKCDYLKQVFFDEDLKVYAKVAQIGNSSVDVHYMAKDQHGSICLTGRGRLVQVSKRTGKGVPWTEGMKGLFLENKKVFHE
jgi:acyl-CoA thioester hydrolase